VAGQARGADVPPPPRLTIRRLAADEVERVDAHLPLHRLGQEGTYLVAWDDTAPIGHAFLVWTGTKLGVPEVQDVWVAPERRREGVATALTAAAEAEATRQGADRISLSVGHENAEARALYEKLGYEDAGVEPERVVGTILLRGRAVEVDDTLLFLAKPLDAGRV
jgi:GNAT superfamily N-acetyltransferase